MTTLRERFFNRLAGRDDHAALFVPDISSWYQAHRIDVTREGQKYGPGELIPDDDPMHALPGAMPREYRSLTHLGLHRAMDAPIPVHNYHWLEESFDGVDHAIAQTGLERVETWETPHGTLTRRYRMAPDDGSWAIVEFPVKSVADLAALRDVFESLRLRARHEQIAGLAREIGDAGFQDLPVLRSPLGLLVHEYVGMEGFTYMLFDHKADVEGMLEYLAGKRLEAAGLAAGTAARVVILSDHIDENLLAPPLFAKYALPFYRSFADILHASGKIFSCHMDGNLKRLLPHLKESGLDLYDGCTPEPMNNYAVEDLAESIGPGMRAFCGVPSTLFAQDLPDRVILDYAGRIIDALGDKAILNVGDILPINGDIRQVALIAEMVRGL